MIRKFVQRSILCAFDMTPMEKKTGKTASLKHRINGKQKKEHSSGGSEDSKTKKERLSPAGEDRKIKKECSSPVGEAKKCKENVLRPRAMIKNVKETLIARWRS